MTSSAWSSSSAMDPLPCESKYSTLDLSLSNSEENSMIRINSNHHCNICRLRETTSMQFCLEGRENVWHRGFGHLLACRSWEHDIQCILVCRGIFGWGLGKSWILGTRWEQKCVTREWVPLGVQLVRRILHKGPKNALG